MKGLKSNKIEPMDDPLYPSLGTNGWCNHSLLMVVFMTLCEEYPMLKLSHLEVSIGHHIKINKINGLKVRNTAYIWPCILCIPCIPSIRY